MEQVSQNVSRFSFILDLKQLPTHFNPCYPSSGDRRQRRGSRSARPQPSISSRCRCLVWTRTPRPRPRPTWPAQARCRAPRPRPPPPRPPPPTPAPPLTSGVTPRVSTPSRVSSLGQSQPIDQIQSVLAKSRSSLIVLLTKVHNIQSIITIHNSVSSCSFRMRILPLLSILQRGQENK